MPRYGFNFQWMTSWSPTAKPQPPDEKALDFLAHFGLDFVRIPTDYRFWTTDFEYTKPNEEVFEWFDKYLHELRTRGIHMSLNFHRAPGYCINSNHLERDNLWLDEVAQDGFVYQWEAMAKHFKGVSNKEISFDLINEPPAIGQYGFNRDIHQRVIRRAVAAIRAIDPDREIVVNGIDGGNLANPELADLGVIHSGRGYQPMTVSHYLASWWAPGPTLPFPKYPNGEWEGVIWNREALVKFYQPWRDVQAMGVPIHIGEFGCYEKTPNDIALRWFKDLFSVFKEFGWGYSLWNFVGSFGIIGHQRPGTKFEELLGYQVDRDLLDLFLGGRVI